MPVTYAELPEPETVTLSPFWRARAYKASKAVEPTGIVTLPLDRTLPLAVALTVTVSVAVGTTGVGVTGVLLFDTVPVELFDEVLEDVELVVVGVVIVVGATVEGVVVVVLSLALSYLVAKTNFFIS